MSDQDANQVDMPAQPEPSEYTKQLLSDVGGGGGLRVPKNINDAVGLIKVMSKSSPPPPATSGDGHGKINLSEVQCACARMADVSVCKPFNTGVINAIQAICPGCDKEFKGLSRLVCCTCKQIIAWIKPHKLPNGFSFLPDKCYHTEICGFCDTSVKSATIIEKLIYERRISGKSPKTTKQNESTVHQRSQRPRNTPSPKAR